MTDAMALALAAQSFLGTPFRVRGRDPQTGLDCIGLVSASLDAIGRKPPVLPQYAMRNVERARFNPLLADLGLVRAEIGPQPGDIVLMRPSAAQYHLGILGPDKELIHAHASLRRVVASPAAPPWPVEARWMVGLI